MTSHAFRRVVLSRIAGFGSRTKRTFRMKLERWVSGSEGAQANGREPIVQDGARRRFLWLMVEYFRTLGYSDVKARLPGHCAPNVLNGTLERYLFVWFGRAHPTARQLARANAELAVSAS